MPFRATPTSRQERPMFSIPLQRYNKILKPQRMESFFQVVIGNIASNMPRHTEVPVSTYSAPLSLCLYQSNGLTHGASQVSRFPTNHQAVQIVALLHTRQYPNDSPGLVFRSLGKHVVPSVRTVLQRRVLKQLLLLLCDCWYHKP